jgi:hypothetical protein
MKRTSKIIASLAASLIAAYCLSGCVVRARPRPVYVAPRPVYVSQPAPVYVTQPAPVYVTQPAPVVQGSATVIVR